MPRRNPETEEEGRLVFKKVLVGGVFFTLGGIVTYAVLDKAFTSQIGPGSALVGIVIGIGLLSIGVVLAMSQKKVA